MDRFLNLSFLFNLYFRLTKKEHQKMKITLIQTDIIWENKLKNLERIREIISVSPAGTDIIILPEMFNTGFSMNPGDLAEKPDSLTREWLQDIAATYGSGICGSYIIENDMHYYNRWIFVSPDNEIWSYDKRHLFSPGCEDQLFTRGKERIVFNFRGLRICPNICYDLRFPVWSRNRNDYDLLINSSNWPGSRRDVWLTLLKARALENQCYVAGVNRIGIDGTGVKYCGDSMIIGPKGETIASGSLNSECIVSGEISLSDLADFREKFPVLNDGDDFTLDL
jgi:omega-amidase